MDNDETDHSFAAPTVKGPSVSGGTSNHQKIECYLIAIYIICSVRLKG